MPIIGTPCRAAIRRRVAGTAASKRYDRLLNSILPFSLLAGSRIDEHWPEARGEDYAGADFEIS
jgi:hypothetical protein